MASVSPEQWRTLQGIHRGGALRQEFLAAWSNGRAFLRATDGLRDRLPNVIEWKGAIRAPGDEVVPADLRIDHVYLVSCKYLSKIVLNASPPRLFDRLLMGGHGQQGTDWFQTVAPAELGALYAAARDHLGLALPTSLAALTASHRGDLASALAGKWPSPLRDEATRFAQVVAERTAGRWSDSLTGPGVRERMLWRLLRIGSAPYFVLGVDATSSLRLRVHTPWDWSQAYRLAAFDIGTQASQQPVVTWRAAVEDRNSGLTTEVAGHVEVRWSHGKFKGPPEAKVYLDTPHHRVPGYVPLT